MEDEQKRRGLGMHDRAAESIRWPAAPTRSGQEDVERGVLGGRAHGARLGGRIANAA
jgi:hypothetical protein